MIDAAHLPPERLSLSNRMICTQAVERGWKAWVYYPDSPHLQLQRPDGTLLELFSSAPPSTSYVAGARTDDKYFTHLVLERAGLPVVATHFVRDEASAVDRAREFLLAGKRFVVKPLDAAHGNGVSKGLDTIDALPDAISHAREYSPRVIIQEFVPNAVDARVLCIAGKAVASLVRLPARVIGDGTHTVSELIDLENTGDRRGANYSKALSLIDRKRAAAYLGDALGSVPRSGEYVQVVATANVGTGGETIDVTDAMPGWLTTLAEKAADILQVPCCGVDFLLSAMPEPDAHPLSLAATIIELNKAPALFMHELPTYGTSRPVVRAFLDYLATL